MTDSLNLAGYELIGGASAFRLAEGWDLGVGEPDTSSIASLLLDGEVIVGNRTHNRTITLPLEILGAAITSRDAITQQVNALAQAVNVRTGDTFPLLWTPSGGRVLQFDCYRATVARTRTLRRDNQLVGQVTVTFQAAPFGKSTTPQTISGTVTATLQLDNMDAARTGATLNTTKKYEGSGSNQITMTVTTGFGGTTATGAVSRTGMTATDVSSYASVTFRSAMLTSPRTTVTYKVTLWSSGGSTTYASQTTLVSTGFALISVNLGAVSSTTGTGVDLTAVTAYTITVNTNSSDPVLIDDLRAAPAASAGITTTNGRVMNVAGVLGSARTPVALAVKETVSSLASLLLHSPPEDQDPDLTILQALNTSLADQVVTIPAGNSGFDGTYGIWLAVASTSGSATQVVTVTITQKAAANVVGSPTVITATYTAPDSDNLIPVGNVTLPLYAIPADNTQTSYTIEVNRTSGVDLYSEIAFCDTRGQTIQVTPPVPVQMIYVEEPDPVTGFGQVLASRNTNDRSVAYSVLGNALVTGGPIQFEPGSNKLLALTPVAGLPIVTATLYPRWLDERAS